MYSQGKYLICNLRKDPDANKYVDYIVLKL